MSTQAPKHVHLTLRVNGESQEVSFAPYKTLLEVPRPRGRRAPKPHCS